MVLKDIAGLFPVVWGEPGQEPWDAAAALPAPAVLAGETKRNEGFIWEQGAARMG